jgi:hypothetical protein
MSFIFEEILLVDVENCCVVEEVLSALVCIEIIFGFVVVVDVSGGIEVSVEIIFCVAALDVITNVVFKIDIEFGVIFEECVPDPVVIPIPPSFVEDTTVVETKLSYEITGEMIVDVPELSNEVDPVVKSILLLVVEDDELVFLVLELPEL